MAPLMETLLLDPEHMRQDQDEAVKGAISHGR
jgi:hypothetical protein